MLPYNKNLKANSKELRKNMTPEEKHLWYDFLKSLPFTVHRQKSLCNYIVDFYIADAKLAIEIDGRQHLTPEHQRSDKERDLTLNSLGITIFRCSNSDIRDNFKTVCEKILELLNISASDLDASDVRR